MVDRLYVTRGSKTFGPFSAAQLRQLASAGRLRPTDGIRREGMDRPVLAANVRNLFPAPQPAADPAGAAAGPPSPAAVSSSPLPGSPGSTGEPGPAAADGAGSPPPASPRQAVPREGPPTQPEPARKRRAVALKGAVLLSQDGVYVHYRKKCPQCGFEDSCRSSMLIGQGVCRAFFFCRKCRKNQEVHIQGRMQ